MDHDQVKELLPLEALGLLDGDEARALTAHLATVCDECEAELRTLREALAAMALAEAGQATAAPGQSPVDRVWSRLESRLGPTLSAASSSMDPSRQPVRSAAREVDAGGRRGVARGWRVAAVLGAAAALLMVVVAGNFANQLSSSQHDSAIQLAALDERLRGLSEKLISRDRELISLRQEAAANRQMIHAVLAPDLRTIKLGPLPPAPDAAGLVAISTSRRQSLLQVAGLPPAPPDKTYEFWWIGAKSGPVRAALFTAGPNGGATVVPSMPPPGEVILAGAVTLEPAGGTDKPTGAMYLKGAP
ncbi:MAG TPA: anti-sigma factor [Candidatus Binataceae bacterium]|nr:anti-sigma factor [Candidatus Binataceae bacterium]